MQKSLQCVVTLLFLVVTGASAESDTFAQPNDSNFAREILEKSDQISYRKNFDCEEQSLNDYLQKYARKNSEGDISQSHVLLGHDPHEFFHILRLFFTNDVDRFFVGNDTYQLV